jgi:hypothetical protein
VVILQDRTTFGGVLLCDPNVCFPHPIQSFLGTRRRGLGRFEQLVGDRTAGKQETTDGEAKDQASTSSSHRTISDSFHSSTPQKYI